MVVIIYIHLLVWWWLQVFYRPLTESKVIPENELDAIFVNWKELIHCNRKLVKSVKLPHRSIIITFSSQIQ